MTENTVDNSNLVSKDKNVSQQCNIYSNNDEINKIIDECNMVCKLSICQRNIYDLIAEKIYNAGLFPAFCMEAFRKIWYEDGFVLNAMLLQTANTFVENADAPIHLCITGNTQEGKSESVSTASKLLPMKFVCDSTFSQTALYHSQEFGISDRSTILADDMSMDDDDELLRTILTKWETGAERRTFVDRKWATVQTPKRLNVILTTVLSPSKSSDLNQDESRYLNIEIKRKPEDIQAIREFMQIEIANIDEEKNVIDSVWENHIKTNKKIERSDVIEADLPLRDFKRYLTMIKASALLHGRKTTNDDDIEFVNKLLSYTRTSISSTVAGLLPDELVVYNYLKSNKGESYQLAELQKPCNLQYNRISRALYGREGTLSNPKGGLVSKKRKVVVAKDGSDHIYRVRYEP